MTLKVGASMLEHRQPLDSPPAGDSRPTAEPGLRVQLAEPGLLLLQSPSECVLQDALRSELSLELPLAGETRARGIYALLWLTPAEWLLECPVRDVAALRSAFTRRLGKSLAVATVMSDAFACFDLSGAQTPDVLASGCGLDLRADNFPVGRVVRTSLADIPAIIRKTGAPDGFRCLVDRSYARHIRDWLLISTP